MQKSRVNFLRNSYSSFSLSPRDRMIYETRRSVEINPDDLRPDSYSEQHDIIMSDTSGSTLTMTKPTNNWMSQTNQMLLQRMARFSEEDRQRLQEELEVCRKELVDKGIVRRPFLNDGFFRTKIKRLTGASKDNNKPTLSAVNADYSKSSLKQSSSNKTKSSPSLESVSLSPSKTNVPSPNINAVSTSSPLGNWFWQYSKTPLREPVTLLQSQQMDKTALKLNNSLLFYVHQAETGKSKIEALHMLQNVLKKCQDSEHLCDEFYMQLIKQTTDNSDPNGPQNQSVWQVLCVCCAIVSPHDQVITRYLKAHLNKCALDTTTEEGRFATYCQKCLTRCLEKQPRKCPPAILEIKAIINRRPANIEVHLMSGDTKSVDFHSHNTIGEILRIIRNKVGLHSSAFGWAIMENVGKKEKHSNPSDYIGDVIHKWEIFAGHHHNHSTGDLRFFLRKRLFIQPYVNANDTIEVELVAHQMAAEIFDGRIILDVETAVRLCALRALIENVDAESAMRILPRTMRASLAQEQVVSEIYRMEVMELQRDETPYSSPDSMDPHKARLHTLILQFISTCQFAENFGTEIFSAEQTFQPLWPPKVHLAVNEKGLRILQMEEGKRQVLMVVPYAEIVSFSAESRMQLMIYTTHQERLTFQSRKTSQIVILLRDYMLALNYLNENDFYKSPTSKATGNRSLRDSLVALDEEGSQPKEAHEENEFDQSRSSTTTVQVLSAREPLQHGPSPTMPETSYLSKFRLSLRHKYRRNETDVNNPSTATSSLRKFSSQRPRSLLSRRRCPMNEQSSPSSRDETMLGQPTLSRGSSIDLLETSLSIYSSAMKESSNIPLSNESYNNSSSPSLKASKEKEYVTNSVPTVECPHEIERVSSPAPTTTSSIGFVSSTANSPPFSSSLDTGTDESIDNHALSVPRREAFRPVDSTTKHTHRQPHNALKPNPIHPNKISPSSEFLSIANIESAASISIPQVIKKSVCRTKSDHGTVTSSTLPRNVSLSSPSSTKKTQWELDAIAHLAVEPCGSPSRIASTAAEPSVRPSAMRRFNTLKKTSIDSIKGNSPSPRGQGCHRRETFL